MTTNAGADQISRPSIGFTLQDHTKDSSEVIKKTFTPEFRNRLDAMIQFKALTPEIIQNVVDKFIIELETQLEEKNVTIQVEPNAKQWLAENGFDPVMGARPMSRVIQDNIKKNLADEILFGELIEGGHVIIDEKDGELTLDIKSSVVTS